ncbi:multidrug efflux pump subunit AcrA (membrane-fusion protein) [Hypnocyclicus thermotrophus]|uniref:Multidrug efflux pump subunit AcrA (Membrane-fusion protein) n=1 Tax=Hypnocyclicus thermotrophus TaxID=1627895 RepID=A0AA46I4W2_9FUSO|nr:efflux RND transporter periplasmic adaptor subunit [Hypnocyclicus thermotrophus]TDT67346.1 multidrug efflux pump subunit AcrA (membrane-fusion protein) [Hypnocyclicus thermotrophus]
MKKSIIGLLIIVLGISGYYFLLNGNKKNEKEVKDNKVIVIPVRETEFKNSITADGKVELKNEEEIFINKALRVEKVNFEEDDTVKAGDILITFDEEERNDLIREIESKKIQIKEQNLIIENNKFETSNIDIESQKLEMENIKKDIENIKNNLILAKLSLENLNKELEDAKKEYEVNKELFEIEGVTITELNNSKNTVNSLSESIKQKENEINSYKKELIQKNDEYELSNKKLIKLQYDYKKAETVRKNTIKEANYAIQRLELDIATLEEDLEKTVKYIASPVDGTITENNATENFMASTDTYLMKIADINSQIITAEVSAEDIDNVKVGQDVIITFNDKKTLGKVSKISSVATTVSGNGYEDVYVEIEVTYDSKTAGFRPGYSVELEIVTSKIENAKVVSSFAIKKDGKNNYVLVYNNGEAQRKNIKIIEKTKKISVIEGLEIGDKVIVNSANIKAGDKVVLTDKIISEIPKNTSQDDNEEPGPGPGLGGGKRPN